VILLFQEGNAPEIKDHGL